MESIHIAPVMPQLTLGAASSTNMSSERILDSTRFTELTVTNSTLEAAPKKKRNHGERMKRSRERNRIHARKTRQRKKEQLQSLQTKAEQLKGEQINLKLCINEKNTANILCCLLSNNQGSQSSCAEDPRVEALLTRPEEEIPDPSKLPALQPLILPSGAQHSKRSNNNINDNLQSQQPPNDGIDYELLGKDRSKCTPAELDQIRRERNRMHAKRTRDRKRLFMEEMADMCKILEGENLILQQHLNELNGIKTTPERTAAAPETTQTQTFTSLIAMVSPSLSPTTAPNQSPRYGESMQPLTSQNGDQMKTLLDVASGFGFDLNNTGVLGNNSKITNTNTACDVSISSEDPMDHSSRPMKKRRQFPPSCAASSDEDGTE
uniref:BZIP domain-containing protein n=1 Tax=Pseudo-nitzschia australis TaxID=44445 RepID=A0A7S4AQ14_9STRA